MSIMTRQEFLDIRSFIEEHCGICLGDEKEYLVESRLTVLMATNGCKSIGELHKKAVSEKASGLRDKILDAMTTNETLWFRDGYPFKLLAEEFLPELHEEFKSGKRIFANIWSCACSTGQEPYSIAMTILDYQKKHPDFPVEKIKITATDISDPILLLARSGRYDKFTMSRGMDEAHLSQYFDGDEKIWTIKDSVRNLVQFKRLNILDKFDDVPTMDIVFCRNVAIYFSSKTKSQMFEKIAQKLSSFGILIVGGAESLTGITESFSNKIKPIGLYYKKRVPL